MIINITKVHLKLQFESAGMNSNKLLTPLIYCVPLCMLNRNLIVFPILDYIRYKVNFHLHSKKEKKKETIYPESD